MKLLIDARSLGRKPSGIGMYTYHAVKGLLERTDADIVLLSDVCESRELRELSDHPRCRLMLLGRVIQKNLSLFFYYRFVQKAIFAVKPDIFWECNNLVPIKLNNPFGKMAATIHDVFPVTLRRYYGRVYEQYFRYGLKKTIRHFDLLIYNSEETKRETERLFPEAKKKRDHIGYIIVPKLPPLPIENDRCFLYVGNIERRKGGDLLLDAYRHYRKRGGTMGLKLGGLIREEDLKTSLEALEKEYGEVHYLGYLTEEERNRAFAGCGCFIFPSNAEGFGIPVVEAMNYYKPVIVRELTIYHEIIGDCISYAPVGKNREEDAFLLAKAMLDMPDSVDKDAYDAVILRYLPEALTAGIYKSFLALAGHDETGKEATKKK